MSETEPVARKLLLLVEDTEDDEALIIRALRKTSLDVDVVVARDGEDAANYLFAEGRYAGRDPSRQPDVVVSDLKLPKLDGLELVTRIRNTETTQAVPVVMLSTSAQPDDLRRAYRHGVNSYVTKPIDAVSFSAVVREVSAYWLTLNELPPPSLTTFAAEDT